VVLFSGSCRFFPGPAGWLGLALLGGCGKAQAVRDDAAIGAPSAAVVAVDAAAPAPAVTLPPYDLEADVRERIDAARRAVDASAAPVQVVGGLYVFVAADHGGPLFDEAVRLANQGLPLLLSGGRFDKPPDRAVTVYAYSNEDRYFEGCARLLGKKEACDSPFGRYVMNGRFIVANLTRGVSTVLHEMVHPIVQTDDPMAPAWLDEGIGALFEVPRFDPPGEIHGWSDWRLTGLQKAIGSVRLEELFSMSDDGFRDAETLLLHEAEARFLCQWLDEQGLLWRLYRGRKAAGATDPRGEATFTQLVGKSPADVSDTWKRWVSSLRIHGR